jgi:hypothetical protein
MKEISYNILGVEEIKIKEYFHKYLIENFYENIFSYINSDLENKCSILLINNILIPIIVL